MTLRQYMTNRKTGELTRGALSRVAEHLGVSINTVKRWLSGEWSPCVETHRRIQDMIHARTPMTAKSTRPKYLRRNKLQTISL